MREIGRVIRLQVQRDSLKKGEHPSRYYDPAALVDAPALRLGPDGAWALLDGAEIVDVHNRLHPQAKNRGDKGLSINFSGHYRRMAERFGKHLTPGQAGENILVDFDGWVELSALAGGLWLEAQDERLIYLSGALIARPCEPFTTFALAIGERVPADHLKKGLQFLDEGTRGYYLSLGGEEGVVHLGGRVYLTDRP
jgi:hypothetical protein